MKEKDGDGGASTARFVLSNSFFGATSVAPAPENRALRGSGFVERPALFFSSLGEIEPLPHPHAGSVASTSIWHHALSTVIGNHGHGGLAPLQRVMPRYQQPVSASTPDPPTHQLDKLR